jgi:hypothetical protein
MGRFERDCDRLIKPNPSGISAAASTMTAALPATIAARAKVG